MFIAPKYKELGVKALWSYVKVVEELCKYFPSYSEDEVPERDYLWTVISSIMPRETKTLIQSTREERSVRSQDSEDLVEITPAMKEEIFSAVAQKSK